MLDYNAPLPPVESLSLAKVDARLVWVDFMPGSGEPRWQAWEAVEAECGHTHVVESPGGGELCEKERDDGSVCDAVVPETDGPMMSWAWPLSLRYSYADVPIHQRPENVAESLTHLPVCVVEHEEHGALLALTGGGMDLLWELCEAYIRLGLAPPFALCGLPRMAGRGENAHDRHIIEACQRSCEHIIRHAEAVNAHLASSYRKG